MTTVVHWFIPLPDPVLLPVHHSWQAPAGTVEGVQLLSITSRQVERRMRALDDMDAMMQAVYASIPGSRSTEPKSQEATSAVHEPATVMEVVAAFDRAPDRKLRSDAFDAGLALIREVLRAYMRITHDAIGVPTLQSLPPTIPLVEREVVDNDQGYPGQSSLFLPSLGQIRSMHLQPPTPQQAEQLKYLHEQRNRVFSTYLDLHLDAFRQLEREGDYRGALLSCATAAESLLDELLLHGLWESNKEPAEVAPLFSNTRAGTLSRLPALGELLGGNWSFKSQGAVKDWQVKIAGPRNRIVHAGSLPSMEEAREAIAGLKALEQHCATALASPHNIKRLIFTALALVGRPGLMKRNLLSRSLEKKIEDWRGPDQVLTFSRWRTALAQESGEPGDRPRPNPVEAVVYVIWHPGRRREWVMVDKASGRAARTGDRMLEMSPAIRGNLEQLLASLDSHPQTGRVSTMLTGVIGGHPTSPWEPLRSLLPLNGVMFDGRDQV